MTQTVNPLLTVDMTRLPPPLFVQQGDKVTYIITLTNNGPVTATGVTLTYNLPGGVTFVSATGTYTKKNGTLSFSIGTLAPGASATIKIAVRPTKVGIITNTVTLIDDQHDLVSASINTRVVIKLAGVV
jgi:uncharacterized repeat protein (TIGR01451 family)